MSASTATNSLAGMVHGVVVRRRPDDERPLAVLQGELHVDGGGFDFVVLHLVVGDGRLTPRALVDGALAAFDEAVLVDLLERPPRRLHVLR